MKHKLVTTLLGALVGLSFTGCATNASRDIASENSAPGKSHVEQFEKRTDHSDRLGAP